MEGWKRLLSLNLALLLLLAAVLPVAAASASEAETVTWILNAGDGTWKDQDVPARQVTLRADQYLDLAAYSNQLYRNGYVLTCWESESGVQYGIDAQVSPGEMVLYTTITTGNLVLYAGWETEKPYASAELDQANGVATITFQTNALDDRCLILASYDRNKRMRNTAVGTKVESKQWTFSIGQDPAAVTWKLFCLEKGTGVPIQKEIDIEFRKKSE